VSGNLLTQVLGQSEHIHELLEQSVEELSSANIGIEHELAHRDALPGVKSALDKNETVARKLKEASERLAAVNQALQIGIRDRTMVDHLLAAALEQEQGSRNAALHDHLTGLPNRVLFKDRLEHGIAQAKRHRWILAVMFVDLDNFKSINDAYGDLATTPDCFCRRTPTADRDRPAIARCNQDGQHRSKRSHRHLARSCVRGTALPH